MANKKFNRIPSDKEYEKWLDENAIFLKRFINECLNIHVERIEDYYFTEGFSTYTEIYDPYRTIKKES